MSLDIFNPLTFHHIQSRLEIVFYVTTYGYENAKGLSKHTDDKSIESNNKENV